MNLVVLKTFIYLKMEINKNLYPHLYEFHSLGGFNTEEGQDYFHANGTKISREDYYSMKIEVYRRKFGKTKNIHMPETEINPPTPFL
jgi:hypothetical protein